MTFITGMGFKLKLRCPFQKIWGVIVCTWRLGQIFGVVLLNRWALSWPYWPIKLKPGINVKSVGACAKFERMMDCTASTPEA